MANMFEMTYIFGNWLKCLRNGQNIWDVDLWEMAQICGEMTYIFGNWLKCLKMAKIFGKWLRSVGNGSNMWETAWIICQTS